MRGVAAARPGGRRDRALGVSGLTVNMRDDAVRGSLVGLNTFNPPVVVAVVGLWTRQSYGKRLRDTVALLEKECASVAAYLVTDSVPLVPPSVELGARTTGLAIIASLRGPTTSTKTPGWTAGSSTTRSGDRDAVHVRLHAERASANRSGLTQPLHERPEPLRMIGPCPPGHQVSVDHIGCVDERHPPSRRRRQARGTPSCDGPPADQRRRASAGRDTAPPPGHRHRRSA